LAPPAEHLWVRVREIQQGLYQKEILELKALPLEELKARYESRQIES